MSAEIGAKESGSFPVGFYEKQNFLGGAWHSYYDHWEAKKRGVLENPTILNYEYLHITR